MDRLDELPERGLRDHLGVLRRRAPIILGVAFLVAAVALVASLATPKKYSATAEVLYPQSPPALQDPTRLDANRVMQNEARVVRSQVIRVPVQDRIGSPVFTTVRTVRDADTLLITATASTPERAAEVANTTADVYVEVRTQSSADRASATIDAIRQQLSTIDERVAAIDRELPTAAGTAAATLTGERDALVKQRESWQQQLDLVAASNVPQVINHANPPSSPSQPTTVRNVLLALLAGLVLGLATAYIVDHLDDRIRTAEDLRRALNGLPVLAEVTAFGLGDQRARVVSAADPMFSAVSADAPLAGDLLLVPVGARGRDVTPVYEVARRRAAVPLVGAVLAHPGVATAAPEPTPEPV